MNIKKKLSQSKPSTTWRVSNLSLPKGLSCPGHCMSTLNSSSVAWLYLCRMSIKTLQTIGTSSLKHKERKLSVQLTGAGRADIVFLGRDWYEGRPEQEPLRRVTHGLLWFFFRPPFLLSTCLKGCLANFSYLSVEMLTFSSYRFGKFFCLSVFCFILFCFEAVSLYSPSWPLTQSLPDSVSLMPGL